MPKCYWPDAIFIACYLINRLPTKVLHSLSSIQFYSKSHPVEDVPLKIFGCVCYVYNHDPHKNKLFDRVVKSVFWGDSSSQKGYKCFDLVAKRKYVSMDVKFFEDIPYFSDKGKSLSSSEPSEAVLPTLDSIFKPSDVVLPTLDSISNNMHPKRVSTLYNVTNDGSALELLRSDKPLQVY